MGNIGPAAQLLGLGSYVAVCIVLGTLGGRWLDGRLETSPLLTVIGLLLGLALAIYGGVVQLFQVLHTIDQRRKEGKKLP